MPLSAQYLYVGFLRPVVVSFPDIYVNKFSHGSSEYCSCVLQCIVLKMGEKVLLLLEEK